MGNVNPAKPVNTSIEVYMSLFVYRYVLPISLPFVNVCLVECVCLFVWVLVYFLNQMSVCALSASFLIQHFVCVLTLLSIIQ